MQLYYHCASSYYFHANNYYHWVSNHNHRASNYYHYAINLAKLSIIQRNERDVGEKSHIKNCAKALQHNSKIKKEKQISIT